MHVFPNSLEPTAYQPASYGTLVILKLITACLFMLTASIRADEVLVTVHADRKLFTLSDMMIGANMEDLHYQMVGGLDSQLIHGESFFEPSPTQLAAQTGLIDGFANCGGRVSIESNGELVVGNGTRLTSASQATEAGIELKTSGGAGVAICVSPNNSDNKWEWYSGYTAEVISNGVVLARAERANKHLELARAPLDAAGWVRLALRFEAGVITVFANGREVIRHRDERPLSPALWAVVARGETRFRGKFGPNPLLKTPGDAISLRWTKVQTGTAIGGFSLESWGGWFTNSPSQTIIFRGGEGEWGIDNAGLKRWGINLVAGKPYEGYLRVKAAQPTTLWVSLRKADGTIVAEKRLEAGPGIPGGSGGAGQAADVYRRLAFTVTPSEGDGNGRFAIALKKPGCITVGYAFLQPGEWGRYKGLPVRKDLAEALLAQGIRVLRFNGGMIEVPGYRWRNLRGPRDQRPPYDGFYDRYCSSGFGPAEAVAFGKAAGLPVVPALNLDETPEDVADFVATCRPPFYQHANESGFNRKYVDKFKLVAEAVWKVAPGITLVTTSTRPDVRDDATGDVARKKLALHLELAELARMNGKHIMFDSHSFNGAGAVESIASFARWLQRLAPDPKLVSVGILEFNAGAFDFQRGLNHALEMNAAHSAGDVIRAVGMPNVSQPWGVYQTDWKAVLWTQGNIYYTPDKVWFQTAYYVDQMIAQHWASDAVAVESAVSPKALSVFAAKTADGSKLVVRVVNPAGTAQAALLDVRGVALGKSPGLVTVLAHNDPRDSNTRSEPERIRPVSTDWQPTGNPAASTFPPYSFTVIELSLKP